VMCHDPHSTSSSRSAQIVWVEDFESGEAGNWAFRDGDTWAVEEEDGNHYLSLRSRGKPARHRVAGNAGAHEGAGVQQLHANLSGAQHRRARGPWP